MEKTPHVTKGKIHSVMKFVASISTCSVITKTNEFSGQRPYTRDDKNDSLFLVMSLTNMFMMHLTAASQTIAQDKLSEHEFDEKSQFHSNLLWRSSSIKI